MDVTVLGQDLCWSCSNQQKWLQCSLYILFYYLPFSRNHTTSETTVAMNSSQTDVRIPRATPWYWFNCGLSLVFFVGILVPCAIYSYPYYDRGYRYGSSGPWCWITHSAMYGYFFYLEWAFLILCLALVFPTFIVLCCVTRENYGRRRGLQSAQWAKTIFIPYLIFCCYILLPVMISVIEYLVHLCKDNNLGLWYTDAIGKPLSKLFVITASLLLMSCDFQAHSTEEGYGLLRVGQVT